MKRLFPAVLGVCLILSALTLTDTLGVLDFDTLTVYGKGTQAVYTADDLLPPTQGKYVRADLTGDVESVLETLGAREYFRETFDDLVVVYAFSPRFSAYETVRGKRVNVMLAARGSQIAVGSPLLKGSY